MLGPITRSQSKVAQQMQEIQAVGTNRMNENAVIRLRILFQSLPVQEANQMSAASLLS